MKLPDFVVKPDNSLNADDFQMSALWAGYYEPDDVLEIVRWGFDECQVRAALDAVGWADDHYFPLPLAAADSQWMRGKLFGARATTACGVTLQGYVGKERGYIVVFYGDAQYALSEHTPQEVQRLANALRNAEIFPLAVENLVTGDVWSLSLDGYVTRPS